MFSNEYLNIAFSSLCVYVFIVLAIRITGRKELSQLSVIDLVFILLISNAVQNAMVGPNTSLVGGLVAAGTLFVINFLLKDLMFRSRKLSKFIQGSEMLLIYSGTVNQRNLKRVKMSMEELEEAVREHGVFNVKDVDLAVLEVDGNISVLSENYQHKTVRKRKMPRRLQKNT